MFESQDQFISAIEGLRTEINTVSGDQDAAKKQKKTADAQHASIANKIRHYVFHARLNDGIAIDALFAKDGTLHDLRQYKSHVDKIISLSSPKSDYFGMKVSAKRDSESEEPKYYYFDSTADVDTSTLRQDLLNVASVPNYGTLYKDLKAKAKELDNAAAAAVSERTAAVDAARGAGHVDSTLEGMTAEEVVAVADSDSDSAAAESARNAITLGRAVVEENKALSAQHDAYQRAVSAAHQLNADQRAALVEEIMGMDRAADTDTDTDTDTDSAAPAA